MVPKALDNWSREEWVKECDCGECDECYEREERERLEYLEAQADNELMRWKEERK